MWHHRQRQQTEADRAHRQADIRQVFARHRHRMSALLMRTTAKAQQEAGRRLIETLELETRGHAASCAGMGGRHPAALPKELTDETPGQD